MTSILLVALCLAQADEKSVRDFPDDPKPPLKLVPVFHREATFVAKDRHLRFLNVTLPGEPRPVFRLNWIGDLNVGIALAEEQTAVIVTDGTTIFRVGEKGDSTKLGAMSDFRAEAAGKDGAGDSFNGSILWFFATSNSRKFLFFVPDAVDWGKMGRLDLESKTLKTIDVPFAAGADVDLDAGVAYIPEIPPDRRIAVKDFDEKIDRHLATTIDVGFCKLSPDKKRLLLWNADNVPHSAIALIDLKTGKEAVLPVDGCCATWGDDKTIFFVRGSNSLCQYRLGAADATDVITLTGKPAANWGMVPCVSADKTWLAWGWTSQRGQNLEHGTILVDLQNRDYRSLTGWWHNVQWLAGRGKPE
jgi:hypothetical protein